MNIIQADTILRIKTAKELFIEYANSLNFELCFQDFDKELAGLPGFYAPPEGRLLLAELNSKVAGCIALRKLEEDICEMKRLYVKPDFRGNNIGKFLVEKLINEAKFIGYKKMRLDTVPAMQTALILYKSKGFYEIKPYRLNPVPGAVYLELEL
jgi:ribosomal protein S18 acetylase RimI-like enzyme